MALPRATRWVLGGAAALAALSGAFTLGVVAGAGSQESAGVLDEAADRIAAESLVPVDRRTLDAAAVAAMLRATSDPWGTWQADDVPGAATGGYVGVGLWLRTGEDGVAVVAQVALGSPAEQAGVAVGDEVRAVAGHSVKGSTVPAVAGALRGPAGSRVEVVLARDAQVRSTVLSRAAVAPPRVTVIVAPDQAGAGPVAVVTVPTFERGSAREVREALATVEAPRGIVLDLRGNAGGLLDEAVETAGVFLDGGPVVRYSRRDGSEHELSAGGSGDTATPLVVLVDGGSASAAEVVAGALQDRGRAVLVGSRTFGKGSVQEPAALADGSSLRLTVARYTTPAGRSLEGVGLEPDIAVAPGSEPGVAVRRGVEVLSGLLAVSAGGSG